MRSVFFILIILLPLFSCNNNSKDHNTSTDPVKQREWIIEELKTLQTALTSKDKEQVQQFLSFPLTDSVIGIYLQDQDFTAEKEKNNKQVTKEMFSDYFDQIFQGVRLNDFGTLLATLKPEELKSKDSLYRHFSDTTTPCYMFYKMWVSGDSATLQIGNNINPGFRDDKGNKADDETWGCMYTLTCLFRLNGKKLELVRQVFAD